MGIFLIMRAKAKQAHKGDGKANKISASKPPTAAQ